MLPDRVSNPGPLTYESGTLLTYESIFWLIICRCLIFHFQVHESAGIATRLDQISMGDVIFFLEFPY